MLQFITSKDILTRVSVSIVVACLRAVIAFSTAMLIARMLGPGEYGRIIFLIAAHTAIKQFLDMGSSSAFFTFISEGIRSKYFILLYWGWLCVQFCTLSLLIFLIIPEDLLNKIWQGEHKNLIFLALVSSFLQGVIWQTAAQMGESIRETGKVQLVGIVTLTIHLILIIFIWLLGYLSINIIFILIAVEWAIASVCIYKLYNYRTNDNSSESFLSVLGEYKNYCIPLIPLAWLGAVHDFFDRWMLQTWGGSKEQAYFGVALQISSVGLLTTTAVMRIFWKEIAEVNKGENYNKMGQLYSKVSKVLFFSTTFTVLGMLPWASEILSITAGEAYLGGLITFSLMLMYPIHQSLGILSNTMLYATSNTKLMFWIHSSTLISGLVLTYIILAPSDARFPGFNLSSVGLAVKYLIVQVIVVTIAHWLICRKYGWSHDILYQVVMFLGILAVGFGSFFISSQMLYFLPLFIRIILYSILYVSLIMIFAKKNLHLIGLTTEDITIAKNFIKSYKDSS